MNDSIIGIVACVGLLALIAVMAILILIGRDKMFRAFWRQRHPPIKLAADRIAFETRIWKPDWEFFERHLQRHAPAALRELYADRELLFSGGFQYDDFHFISSFEILHAKALTDTRDLIGFDVVPIANSDGDIIYLRPGPRESDTVLITYHDGLDTAELAPDVATFLQRCRVRLNERHSYSNNVDAV